MKEKKSAPSFLEEMETVLGTPDRQNAIGEPQLEQLQGTLCEPHFQLLQKYGTAVFCEGRVRLLNPLDWKDLGTTALRHVPVFSNFEFQPVLLGAFGQIDFINVQRGIFLTYHLFKQHVIFLEDEVAAQLDGATVFQDSLRFTDLEDYDLLDDDGDSIFQQLSDRLGALGDTEVFALTPELMPDNGLDIDIEKIDLRECLHALEERPRLIAL